MNRMLAVVLAALSIASIACQKQEPSKVSTQDVQQRASQTANAAVDYAKQEKDEYIRKAQSEIDDIKTGIDDMKTRAKSASAKARSALNRDIQAADRKWKVAQDRLGELRGAGADAWDNVKSGVESAVMELKQSVARATERFKH